MHDWVLDCSAALALVMADEEGRAVEDIVRKIVLADASIRVPALFWYEVCNGLVMAERRNRISWTRLREHEADLVALPVVAEESPDAFIRQRIRELAAAHQLTAYDAAYLELADRLGAPLKTFDAHLLKLRSEYDLIQ
jgi:predicted nucleic acid-binding protein